MAATATAANVCASVRINSFRAWRLFRACCRVKARGHRSDALDSKIFFSSNQMSHDLCSQPVPSPTLNSCDAGSLTSTPIPPNSTPPNSSPSEPPKPSRLPASRSPRSLRYAPREKRNGRNLIFCLYFWLMRQEHLLRASSDPPPTKTTSAPPPHHERHRQSPVLPHGHGVHRVRGRGLPGRRNRELGRSALPFFRPRVQHPGHSVRRCVFVCPGFPNPTTVLPYKNVHRPCVSALLVTYVVVRSTRDVFVKSREYGY